MPAQAQNAYDSLVVEGAHWFIEAAATFATYEIPTQVLFIEGDTTILGKNYKKLYWGSYGDNVPMTPTVSTYPILQSVNFSGSLREENKRVYYFESIDSTEKLLYDFNLVQGDIGIFQSFNTSSLNFTIDTIYQTYIWGNTRNVYECTESNGNRFVYTEGIGTNQSPINWWWQENGRLLNYCRGTHGECNTWFTSNKNITDNEIFTSYPNPAKDWTNIKYSANLKHLALYDLQGHIMKNFIIDHTGQQTIYIGDIAKGLYFWKINDTDVQKCLKE